MTDTLTSAPLLERVRRLHTHERNGYGPGDCHCDECCDTVDALREADALAADLAAAREQAELDRAEILRQQELWAEQKRVISRLASERGEAQRELAAARDENQRLREALRQEKRLRVEFGELLTETQKDAACHRAVLEPASRPEGREGMVTVYDHEDRYLGCMGIETWRAALAAPAAEYEVVDAPDGQPVISQKRPVPAAEEPK